YPRNHQNHHEPRHQMHKATVHLLCGIQRIPTVPEQDRRPYEQVSEHADGQNGQDQNPVHTSYFSGHVAEGPPKITACTWPTFRMREHQGSNISMEPSERTVGRSS